jgi:hypothetical protein
MDLDICEVMRCKVQIPSGSATGYEITYKNGRKRLIRICFDHWKKHCESERWDLVDHIKPRSRYG